MTEEQNSSEQTTELTPEQEILEIQNRLEAAHKRKAAAEDLKITAARVKILEREQELLTKQISSAQAREERLEEAKRKMAEVSAAKEVERRAQEAARIALENEMAALELAKQKREAHQKRLKQIADDAFRVEREAAQAFEESLRVTVAPEPEPEITLHSPTHPLSRVFGVTQDSPVEPLPAASQEAPLPPERPKVTPEQYEQLAQMWWQTSGVRITATQAMTLQLYTLSDILAAVELVKESKLFPYRDEQYLAVTHVLSNGVSLPELRQRFDDEKLAREEERRARQ